MLLCIFPSFFFKGTKNIINRQSSIDLTLEYVIKVASGEIEVSAVGHGQDDFIPWKRGVSL